MASPTPVRFRAIAPEIELRFSASLEFMDSNRDNIDVAIRFGLGLDAGLYSLSLADEWVVPVMTPELTQTFLTPQSLANAVLIVDQSIDFLDPPFDWPAWFGAMHVDVVPNLGPRFSQANHAIDAALAGVSVPLCGRALVIKDLADGRRVALYPITLPTGARFLCHEGTESRPQVVSSKTWILHTIEKTAHISQSMTLMEQPIV